MAIKRTLGTPTADSTAVSYPSRSGPYDEAYVVPVLPHRVAAAMEGGYFTALNATISTEIAGHAAPAIADTDTKPLIYIYNGGTRYIAPDFIWMRTDTVNASSTASYYTVHLTSELSRDSGGTAITPYSARSDSPITSGATIYFGAVVCTPAASRKVAQVMARSVIAVVEDQYLFTFGQETKLPGFSVSTGTTVVDRIMSLPPCVIAPGGEFLFSLIAPSGASTAWDGEISMGYFER